MQYHKQEVRHIRKLLQKLDGVMERTKGYADCAETSDRQIRAIRSLIAEAAFAFDDILEDHMGEVYEGIPEWERDKPIVPFGDDLNDCPQCRAFHAAAYNGGSRGHRSDREIAREEQRAQEEFRRHLEAHEGGDSPPDVRDDCKVCGF